MISSVGCTEVAGPLSSQHHHQRSRLLSATKGFETLGKFPHQCVTVSPLGWSSFPGSASLRQKPLSSESVVLVSRFVSSFTSSQNSEYQSNPQFGLPGF